MDPPKPSLKMWDTEKKKKEKNVDPFKNLFLASRNKISMVLVLLYTPVQRFSVSCMSDSLTPGRAKAGNFCGKRKKTLGKRHKLDMFSPCLV